MHLSVLTPDSKVLDVTGPGISAGIAKVHCYALIDVEPWDRHLAA